MSAVACESLLLLVDTVRDLDDVVARPEAYLVSIEAEPQRAAQGWRERAARHPYGSEGLVRLRYFGHDLIPAELWDEVTGTWYVLVGCVAGFLAGGHGAGSLAGQPVDLELQWVPAGAIYGVGAQCTLVDPAVFVPGVLDGAARYARWVDQYLGVREGPTSGEIEELRGKLKARRLG